MHDDALVDATMVAVYQISRSVYAMSSRHPLLAERTPAQIRALNFLARDGEQTIGELADSMGVTISTASGLVDKLVDLGLVDRAVNPDDRRQVLIKASEDAAGVIAEIRALRRRQVLGAVDAVRPEQRQCFIESIQALATALSDLSPGPEESSTATAMTR
jgi:DNA-binding MarR family transcriptional regulator